jgi:hypothetical protein
LWASRGPHCKGRIAEGEVLGAELGSNRLYLQVIVASLDTSEVGPIMCACPGHYRLHLDES